MRVLIIAALATASLCGSVSAHRHMAGPGARTDSEEQRGLLATNGREVIGFRQIVCELGCPADHDTFNCTATDFLIGDCVKASIPDHYVVVVGCEGPDAPPYYPTPEPETSTGTTEATSPDTSTTVTDETTRTTSVETTAETGSTTETETESKDTLYPGTTSNISTTFPISTQVTITPESESTTTTTAAVIIPTRHLPTETENPPTEAPPRLRASFFGSSSGKKSRAASSLHANMAARDGAPIPPHTTVRYVWTNNTNASDACATGNASGLVKELVGECFGAGATIGQRLALQRQNHQFGGALDSDKMMYVAPQIVDEKQISKKKKAFHTHRQEKMHIEDGGSGGVVYVINYCLRKGEV